MGEIIDFNREKESDESVIKKAIEDANKLILITEDENMNMRLYSTGVENALDGIDMLHASMGSLIDLVGEHDE